MNKVTRQEATDRTRQPLPKLPTGVAGLDEILHGGLPLARTTLLVGGPGSGKTVLSLEILYRAAKSGHPGIFISFEESAVAVRTNALSMGWDLEALERAGRLVLIHPQIDYRAIRAGEFNIKGLQAILAGHADHIGAELVVIDAVDALMRVFESDSYRDDELYSFYYWLLEREFTTVMTLKARSTRPIEPNYPFLDFLADCVLVLDQRVYEQVATRRLRVTKFRGSGYGSNECPFVISPEGIILMPIASIELMHQAFGSPRSSGHETLDRMLDGGYRRGATALIAGPTGSGKTTIACTFALGAAQRGERTLYVSFEEGRESLLHAMKSPGIDLLPLIESGALEILTAMPESLGVEDHLLRILQVMDRFRPEHLIVDAISASVRMGSDAAAFDFLVRLLSACRERGVTCIFLNQTPRGAAADHITGIGVSSLIDTVLVLDYAVKGGELCRSIFVLKSRGARHSHRVQQLTISDNGIEIDSPMNTNGQETT